MTLEGINFSNEQDDSDQTVENTRFSQETRTRFQRFLSSHALKNTVSNAALAESIAQQLEERAEQRPNED